MAVTRGRPIIVAASTHPGEEDILLEAHRTLAGFFPSLLTVIVPRHPNRGEAIARAIAASGLHVALRSREELPTAATDDLRRRHHGRTGIVLSAGADRVHGRIAGRTWRAKSDRGGQARRRRSLHGPHVFNFADVYEALDGAGGARRADTLEALVKQLGQLLADPAARESRAGRLRARGRAARRRARSHAGRARAVSAAVAARDGSGECVSRPSGTGRHR